jgi:hypothetical protein
MQFYVQHRAKPEQWYNGTSNFFTTADNMQDQATIVSETFEQHTLNAGCAYL